MRWHCMEAQCENTKHRLLYFHMKILYVDIYKFVTGSMNIL